MFFLVDAQRLVSLFASENAALPISRLAAAYEDLAVCPNQKPFSELKDELKTEERSCSSDDQPTSGAESQNSPADLLPEKDSATSLEASPQKMNAVLLVKPVKVSLNRQFYTVSQLVVEPDSLSTSSSIGPPQEEEEEIQAEAEEPSQKDLQSPVKSLEIAKPIRKARQKSKRTSR